MNLFLTIIAWLFLAISVFTVIAVYAARKDPTVILVTAATGKNPCFSAIFKWTLIGLVCAAWIIARHFSS